MKVYVPLRRPKEKVITHRIGWGWLSDLDLSTQDGMGHRWQWRVDRVLGLGRDEHDQPCFYLLLVEITEEDK